MKITQTRIFERQIVYLYQSSYKQDYQVKGDITARYILSKFIDCIDTIDLFENANHSAVIKELYFSSKNILKCSIESLSQRLFVPTRTLLEWRKKYAIVIKKVLSCLNIL